MAKNKDTALRRQLTSLLPPTRIRRLAVDLGAVRRRRKVDVAALVYSLAFGFAVGSRRTLEGLRRTYERITNSTLARSAFYGRFTAGMACLMKQLLDEALAKLAASAPKLRCTLSHFRELLVTDSTIIRCHPALQADYPSVWAHHSPAAFKLNVVINAVGRGPKTFRVVAGKTHDLKLVRCGPWLRDKLLLFDLGFFRCELFDNVGKYGGFFLTRLKRRSNPVIVASHQPGERRFVGWELKHVLPQLHGQSVDFDVQMRWRPNPKTSFDTRTSRYRIIGVWHEESNSYRFYATNVPRRHLKPKHAAAVYAARWEVELFFREVKTLYRARQLRSCNRHVAECLLYAALLSLALSRQLLRAIAKRRRHIRHRLTIDRWSRLLTTVASDLLDLVFGPRRHRAFLDQRLLRLLLREAPDPNLRRLQLPERAQMGRLACSF